MQTCSLHNKLEIVCGDLAGGWAKDISPLLARYHYRRDQPVGVKAVFILRPRTAMRSLGRKPVGAIVYTMPVPCVELRNVATHDVFKGLDRQTQLAMLNRNVRCVSRVVIEPRFRGIGLASRLVRETMPQMNVPIVEAVGIMPLVNPFLEKAGMRAFAPRLRLEHIELVEALSIAGIEEDELIDPTGVQKKLDALPEPTTSFIEGCMQRFLKSHGKRRLMSSGIERTRFVLSKLTDRPAYYIWFHPTLEVTLS